MFTEFETRSLGISIGERIQRVLTRKMGEGTPAERPREQWLRALKGCGFSGIIATLVLDEIMGIRNLSVD